MVRTHQTRTTAATLALLATALVAGCSSNDASPVAYEKPAAAPRPDSVTGVWVPVKEGDRTIQAAKWPNKPLLTLKRDGTFKAVDGCNTVTGKYRWKPGQPLYADGGVSTMIGCNNLTHPITSNTSRWKVRVTESRLVFVDKDGQAAMTYRRA